MRLIRSGVVDGKPFEEWAVRGDIEGFFEDVMSLMDRDRKEKMQPKTYEEYQQAVYAEFQRVTGKDWSKSNIDVTEEFALGLSPSEVVADELWCGEPGEGE